MKRTNKKGFTIVELTIVIAVIAILAAVLIPTFSSIVDKANTSSDIQLVRQANVILAALDVYDGEISEDSAKAELLANGIDISAEPANSNNSFHYIPEKKFYVVFDVKQEKIIFPEDLATELSGWKPSQTARIGNQYYATLKEAVEAAETGDTVDVLQNSDSNQVVNIGKDITIDFNDKTYSISGMKRPTNNEDGKNYVGFYIQNGAKVTLKNGTIKTVQGAYAVIFSQNGHLTMDGLTVDTTSVKTVKEGEDNSMRTPIYTKGGSLTMKDVDISGVTGGNWSVLVEASTEYNVRIEGESKFAGRVIVRNPNKKTVIVKIEENVTVNTLSLGEYEKTQVYKRPSAKCSVQYEGGKVTLEWDNEVQDGYQKMIIVS